MRCRFIGNEICPRGREQGARAIRVHEHEVLRAPPMGPAEHGEGAAFEWMRPARHRHALGETVKVVVMGSMSCVPSTRSTTNVSMDMLVEV